MSKIKQGRKGIRDGGHTGTEKRSTRRSTQTDTPDMLPAGFERSRIRAIPQAYHLFRYKALLWRARKRSAPKIKQVRGSQDMGEESAI